MTHPTGIVQISSDRDVQSLCARLEAAIAARGMTLFAKVDHGAGAREVGMVLRPTVLFVFGAAKGGTPLMQADQILGIDLPLKALVWQDAEGATQLGYVDPRWLAELRGLAPEPTAIAERLQAMLAGLAQEVAGRGAV
jgi:uncharacterized protein (DUF302 family)